MPGPSDIATGNIQLNMLLQATLSPALIVLNTTAEQTFTVPGLLPGDFVSVVKPSAQAGLGIVGVRVSAANTLGITFSNNTGSSITPTAGEVYIIKMLRPENPGPLPTAIT